MVELREACQKVRRDIFDLSNRLLYTEWPTTPLNITGNHAHYMIGKTIRALDDLISALEKMGKEEQAMTTERLKAAKEAYDEAAKARDWAWIVCDEARKARGEDWMAYDEAAKARDEIWTAYVEAVKARNRARMAYVEAREAHDKAGKAHVEVRKAHDEAKVAYDEAGESQVEEE